MGTVRGMLASALLAYLLDPESGRRRRAEVRNKATHGLHQANEAFEKAVRDLGNRLHGLGVRTVEAASGDDAPSDEILVERVRAKLGRVTRHPHAIHVTARDGDVTLAGPILSDEVETMLSAVRHVRGVRRVESDLEPHDEPGNVPSLQGTTQRREPRSELRQRNWSPAARLLVGAAGGWLLSWGYRRRPLGAPVALAGAVLLLRSLTNLEMARLFGVGAGRRAIDIRKTLEVDAPVDDVFRFFSSPERFPRFMSHVREVRKRDGRYHWVVSGPAGTRLDFDAVVTRQEPNRLLAWRTEPGSHVGHAGLLRFEPAESGRTRLSIRMSYNPPAGALGHALAKLLGADPKKQMDQDLVRVKSLLERGKETRFAETVSREATARAAPPEA